MLKQRAGKKVNEADSSEAEVKKLFSEAVKSIIKTIDDIEKNEDTRRMKSVIGTAYTRTKSTFLKENCPPIKFIGEGSSRAAYAMEGGLCMKLAMNEAGTAQNKAEVENTYSSSALEIFPRVHGIGGKCLGILVECVATYDDPYKFSVEFIDCLKFRSWKNGGYDFPTEPVGEFLSEVQKKAAEENSSFDEAVKEAGDESRWQSWKDLAEMVLRPQNAAQKFLRMTAEWAAENPQRLLAADMSNPDNWGLAVRNGEVVPIVLDAGFSEPVKKAFYSH